MKQNTCPNCGADEFEIKGGYKICKYCNTRFEMEKDELPKRGSTVSLLSDIDILLQKCKAEPHNARKYAGRILDIDPTNQEANKILYGR